MSYPGIYIHLKEKHFGNDTNQKFYLKTFRHKTNGIKIKQVVIGGVGDFGFDSIKRIHTNVENTKIGVINGLRDKKDKKGSK